MSVWLGEIACLHTFLILPPTLVVKLHALACFASHLGGRACRIQSARKAIRYNGIRYHLREDFILSSGCLDIPTVPSRHFEVR